LAALDHDTAPLWPPSRTVRPGRVDRTLTWPDRRVTARSVPSRTVSATTTPLRRLSQGLTTPGALRVPAITAVFWALKALSTAMGEASSDFLVHELTPVLAVVL